MSYGEEILNQLLDMYEKRGGYEKSESSMRAVQFEVGKKYLDYVNRYDHEKYKMIHGAIEKLAADGLIEANLNNAGQFTKVKLNVKRVSECYKKLNRISKPEICQKVAEVLAAFQNSESELIRAVVNDWSKQISSYKPLPYSLKYDSEKVAEVLHVLQEIVKLNQETYIRNFSTAMFKDSKKFQKKFKATVERILFDYTENVVEKSKILEIYNLYENPTYVLMKGNVEISFQKSVIHVAEIPGGIALSNASLDYIQQITVHSAKVITIENLTTYHDSDEMDAVQIYLGGYHNRSKQKLLERIYEENTSCGYYHEGDLDVYGFLILENLKEKTNIPFQPLMMDVDTLERFYHAGLYKELEAGDKKIIKDKMDTRLLPYKEVLQFMLEKNCKVEQESIKAVELIMKEKKMEE